MTEETPIQEVTPTATSIAVPAKKTVWKLGRFMIVLNIIIIVLLLLVIGIAAAKYLIFIKQIQKIGIVEQLHEVKVMTTQLQSIQVKQQLELQNIITSISNTQQRRELLPIAEAFAAAKTANTVLLAHGNVKTAVELLQVAQQAISPIPTLITAKETLSHDITNLQVYGKFNDEELIININDLMQKIGDLPQTFDLPLPEQPPATTPTPVTLTTQTTMPKTLWYSFSDSLQRALKSVVVIQHNESVAPPLLPSDQLLNLRLNIQFKLMQAEWAVMYKKLDLYKLCLKDAETWLRAYFPESVLQKRGIISRIHELQNSTFQNQPPTIDSIVILRKTLNEMLPQNLNQPNQPTPQAQPQNKNNAVTQQLQPNGVK